ncbi:MAG: LamG domain-containing protein, partial [Planctomycetota bacterium]
MNLKRKVISACLLVFLAAPLTAGQIDFGAYYTEVTTAQPWEAFSRTGKHADIVVQLSQAGGKLVFWRGNSYLPYWKTGKGQWNLAEIIPRSGDGTRPMPDRSNVYSHVEVIENTPSVVVVHWRYLSSFTAGNPHRNVNTNNFVDELFTITLGGQVKRVIKIGTDKIDDWNDPLNQTTQTLQLREGGVEETSRIAPRKSLSQAGIQGNPGKGPGVVAPALWFKFDEGQGDTTQEDVTRTCSPIPGPKTLWKKGVSGTALEFDGYSTVVSVPAAKVPALAGGSLTLEGWFALGAYPWNWAPIVQQGDDDGYFLGVDSHGYPGFSVKVDGVWQKLSVPNKPPYAGANHLALFNWYHVAGTYNKSDGMMRLTINGKEVAGKSIGKGGIQTAKADVRVGKAGIKRRPTEGTHDTHPSDFGIDGLIDEVKIYNTALDGDQISRSFANFDPGPAITAAPDMPRRRFPVPTTGGKFDAVYTRLPYYETWDNLWRFGEHADVVVGFDQLPTKFVFWRGVSYIPMMVNESNQWFTQEFNETGFSASAPGDCEPMSDKGCWDSHVRIIENNAARKVVHWRYRLENPDHHWANYDANGWGDLADWYYYIYPDGVASKIMRCYTSKPGSWYEWDEQIAVLGEGQHPESVVRKSPVMTLVDSDGKATDYDWNPNPPRPRYQGQVVQKIHFTGQYHPIAIQKFDGGDIYGGERTWYSVFPSWNHWPTSQINSSGRNASFPDRAAHSSISHLFWPFSSQQRGKVGFLEKILMEGMTDQPAASLASLARSWLNAPAVSHVSGGTSQGYDQSHRAYGFQWGASPLRFQIAASDKNPIHNLCFEIRNWKSRTAVAVLTINDVSQAAGPNFRQGINIDTDGTYTLIVWVGMIANTSQEFTITEKTPCVLLALYQIGYCAMTSL